MLIQGFDLGEFTDSLIASITNNPLIALIFWLIVVLIIAIIVVEIFKMRFYYKGTPSRNITKSGKGKVNK